MELKRIGEIPERHMFHIKRVVDIGFYLLEYGKHANIVLFKNIFFITMILFLANLVTIN
jgi:hypothetical protein